MPRINHSHDFRLVAVEHWTGSDPTTTRSYEQRYYRCPICNQSKSALEDKS